MYKVLELLKYNTYTFKLLLEIDF